MDIPKFLTAAEAYPLPTNADGTQMRFSYGTAGFRTVGTTLRSTVFRCGALAAIRSRVTGRACGMVITASHNPEADNGVKLVDCTGGMLPTTWEADAEVLANAPDAEAMRAVIQKLLETDEPAETLHPPPPADFAADPPAPHVFLARDTRPTGPELAAAASAGATAAGAVVTDLGLSTTPQGHFTVYAAYRGWPRTEADYYARLARGYATLCGFQSESDDPTPDAPIFVDCANGVGAEKFVRLLDALEAAGAPLPAELRNDRVSPGALNKDVGADFVQKERSVPKNGGFDSLPPTSKCVSVDGDADRLVYFYRDSTNPERGVRLLDGDKIAVLVATRVGDLLSRCGETLKETLRVGVVQTAYANGASTRYIENTLGLETMCTPTGVKHLHPAAETFDVGVYFEANGHGTALFSDAALSAIAARAADEAVSDAARAAAKSLLALAETINPAVGDALSGVLVVEAVLKAKRWRLEDWDAMYADLPSTQVKVRVRDRSVIVTADAERRVVRPEGMQAAIDAAVTACGEGSAARAFARPSGTEDVVRVYAEARTRETADALALSLAEIVYARAGGLGDEPW